MTVLSMEYLWGEVETLSLDNQKLLLKKLLEKFSQKSKQESVKKEEVKAAKRKIQISPDVKKLAGVISLSNEEVEKALNERVMR